MNPINKFIARHQIYFLPDKGVYVLNKKWASFKLAKGTLVLVLNAKRKELPALPSPLEGPSREREENIEIDEERLRAAIRDGDYYGVFGYTQGESISEVEIKNKFRRFARKYHPDSGITPDEEIMIGIKKAYDTLTHQYKL